MDDALTIPLPDDPALVLDGCRRLLGPNLYGASPGAVGEALIKGRDPARAMGLWSAHLHRLLDGLDWRALHVARPFAGGASLYLAAPPDRLFTAAYVIEAAWHYCASELLDQPAVPLPQMLQDLAAVMTAEANPTLCALLGEAEARGVDHVLDDEAVILGHGCGSAVFSLGALPVPDWAALHDIPLALVTGTNGKTTTTRLIAAMGMAAGLVAGLSSTDAVQVGTQVLDHGDYSGPAGARLLLADKRLELAVLEVARGGILRRGLPVTHASVAVVTNVAADHLGQYGIQTVEDLAQVKLVVHRALRPGGQLVLNAGDALVVAAASPGAHVWFALTPANPQIVAARAAHQPCGWLEDGWLVLSDGKADLRLIAARDVPLTLGAAARYNIENALAAALAARALGLPDDAIRGTLAEFRSDLVHNPGRANEFAVNGARVFVDFAHNPHSIAAVTSALAALPAKRRMVLLSHAGDRSDSDINDLVTGAFALRPDLVMTVENPKYLRGRSPGELPALMRRRAIELGLPPDRVLYADSPAEGAARLIARLQPGDLCLLLVHDERDRIFALLQAASEQGRS